MAAEQGVLPQPDVAAPRSRASLVVRRILAVLAALVCLGVAVPTVAVALRREPGILAILTALMPYVAVVSVVGLLLALLSRDRVVIASPRCSPSSTSRGSCRCSSPTRAARVPRYSE
jgi:hypothetical protein